jgi:hypothetical protein
MKQSKLMSMIESVINIAIGFGISLAAQILILPLLGVAISLTQNFQFALIMTVISIARSFALRRLFEALHIRVPLSPALLAIAAERRRQVDVEGWDAAHDDEHLSGDLAAAAACYASMPTIRHWAALNNEIPDDGIPAEFPWSPEFWKPLDNRRDLVRAGALIVAELDRENRQRKSRKVASQ